MGHEPDSSDCGNFPYRDLLVRSAILKACGSVVCVVTFDIPDDMLKRAGLRINMSPSYIKEHVFQGSGIVIECEPNANGNHYLTVLTTAMLFERTNNLQPADVVAEVYLHDGKIFEARVICCDFHYNLVALRVESNCSMPVANLKLVDDVLPMDPDELLPHSFQLRPHSDVAELVPRDLVIALGRRHTGSLIRGVGFFSKGPSGHKCTEVYGAYFCNYIRDDGGALINRMGEVIGVKFHNKGYPYTTFLSTNIIVRWWNHYKKFREFRRPWLGINVCNLHAASLDLLQHFPNVTTGVIVSKMNGIVRRREFISCIREEEKVTECLELPMTLKTIVSEDSPARLADIQENDIIVQCDGNAVRSILEFFERIWEKVSKSMELGILRKGMCHTIKRVVLPVQETSPDKFYSWRIPRVILKERRRVQEDDDDDDDMSQG